MYSTVGDLGKWAATGLGMSLLPADVAAERLEFKTIPKGEYGLGLMSWDNGWIGHTGQLIGGRRSRSTTPRRAQRSWPS